MTDKLVSIIVPVYNVEKYLHRCVDSILAQTYTNLEVILVNDGSPDNCPTICDEYVAKDSRVKVIHKENGGVSSARNAGLRIFSGEYLTFIDSDDFVGEKYVESLVENTADNIGIVISSYKTVSPDLQFIEYVSGTNTDITVQFNDEFDFSKETINHGICCKLFCRTVIDGLAFSENIFLGEDTLFNAKAFQKSDFIRYITDASYYYVKYDESLSHGKIAENKLSVLSAFDEIINVFPKNSASYFGCIEAYIQKCFSLYGNAVVLQGSNDEVVKRLYSLIKSDKTYSIYKTAHKTLKIRLKYNLLIHFRKLYDALLLLKEPLVKHYT